jgi:hypothetical protein
MKLHRFLPLAVFFASVTLTGAEEPGPRNAGEAVKAKEPVANLELVKNLRVSAMMKQIIGSFGPFSPVEIGETFELDLGNLPLQIIKLSRSAVSIPGFLAIEQVTPVKKNYGWNVIRLSGANDSGKLVIQVNADTLEAGGKVRAYFYQTEADGKILCMAEAEGVLK